MAYGLSVTGENNSYQIDSNTAQTEYLSVISSGEVDGSTTRATITASPPDLVWMHKPTVSNSDGPAGHLRNGYNTTGAVTKYIVTRKTSSLSSFSGDYGLQVYNKADPPVKIFDSRAITEGVNIIDVKTQGTVGGARMVSGVPTLTGNSKSTIVYEGNPAGVYVTTTGSAAGDSASQAGSTYWMQWHFDYVNNKITMMNSSDYGSIEVYENWSMILIGRLQT